MNIQSLTQDLVKALCLIAGAYRGAETEILYHCWPLRLFARPDESKDWDQQGEQVFDFLKNEIAEWNSDLILRGKKLSAAQCREAWSLLLNLEETGKPSRARREEVIQMLGLQRCRWQHWRKNVESLFFKPLALHLIDLYPERAEDYQAA